MLHYEKLFKKCLCSNWRIGTQDIVRGKLELDIQWVFSAFQSHFLSPFSVSLCFCLSVCLSLILCMLVVEWGGSESVRSTKVSRSILKKILSFFSILLASLLHHDPVSLDSTPICQNKVSNCEFSTVTIAPLIF